MLSPRLLNHSGRPQRSTALLRLESLERRDTPSSFNVVGNTLFVEGTAGADAFHFSTDGTTHVAVLNGVIKKYSSASINLVKVDLKGGLDSTKLSGSLDVDTLVLREKRAELIGKGYLVEVLDVETSRGYGHGNDYAKLIDSAGNDTLLYLARRIEATMYRLNGNTNDYLHFTRGFGRVDAIAENGGFDLAKLLDTSGIDTFIATPTHASMSDNSSYYIAASYFDRVEAIASAGKDIAYLHDSVGDDAYQGFPDYSVLKGSGFENSAKSFDYVQALFTKGGSDEAFFYGSTGNDTLSANYIEATLFGASYTNSAIGADRVYVDVTQGGTDKANLYDSPGNDSFNGTGSVGTLYFSGSPTNFVQTVGFDELSLAKVFGGSDTGSLILPLSYTFSSSGFTII